MASIHILSKTLQNHIAAGEVIERPLSVVKELVENSLDAGATHITIEVAQGGRTLLRVEDNGHGMQYDDALLCIQEHATSKIVTSDDLFQIHTYGFRGEALSSISSVSYFTLETQRAEDTHGWKILWEGGEKKEEQMIGRKIGTSITVEHLFFNTPARLKYLKKDETEMQHIQKYCYEISLAHPDKNFTLINDGKVVLDVIPSTIEERVSTIMGKHFLTQSVPIFCDRQDIQIQGFTTKPAFSSSTKRHQHIFINGRPINDHLIGKAILEAYHRIIVPGTHPSYVLFMTIDPSLLDVNVHPRKLEVRFLEPAHIFSVVKGSITQSLEHNILEPTLHVEKHTTAEEISFTKYPRGPEITTQTQESIPSYTSGSKHSSPYAVPSLYIPKNQENLLEHLNIHTRTVTRHYQRIGQIHNCYILAESEGGIFLIDQHAAHERILFEKYLKTSEAKTVQKQTLLTGITLEISREESSLLTTYGEDLQALGFEYEEFGDQQILITALPELLNTKHAEVASIFRSLLHETTKTTMPLLDKEISTIKEKLLAYAACRAAVKFGDSLQPVEQEQLLEDFFALPRRHTCPHGRSSVVEITLSELKKYFDR